MALLEVSNLSTHFELSDGVVHAVDRVSFEVGAGETLGLVGESGCGKSMTALSLLRLVPEPGRIVEGSVRLDGMDLLTQSESTMRRIRGNDIAMIFQDPMTSLNPVLSVGEQIAEAVRVHLGMDKATAWDRAVELLEMVGIPSARRRVHHYPHQFSGGMRQRVMIAIALSCNPRLILADEITTALDVTIQAQILELLRTLAVDSGTGFILITHDLGIVAGMTSRVHVMYAGQIVEKADTHSIFANPRMPYTWGLLGSVPRIDDLSRRRLKQIDGRPPDLLDPKPGCRFAPRCAFSRPICHEQSPELLPAAGGSADHEVRCWGTQDVSEGGWLAELAWRDLPEGDSSEPDEAATR